jgi:hypothetical protein
MYPALHLEIAQTVTAERERGTRRRWLFPRRGEQVETGFRPTPPPLAVVLEHPTLREHRVRRHLAA